MPPERTPAGSLFVVSTPIGNLGDITRRAVETLSAVALVVAEDTRRTRTLLSHLGIADRQLRSLHAHSSEDAVQHVVERLIEGDDVALVTDAGTPGVSDPGRALVAAAAGRGIEVRAVPGPSAVTAAVALSALVEGPFTFLGFLPRSGGARSSSLERIVASREPIVLFEAPQRIAHTLTELAEAIPSRQAFVGRELTKLHEEGLRGSLLELSRHTGEWRGEIVIVVAGSDAPVSADGERQALVQSLLGAAIEAGASPSRVARAFAEVSGLPKRELYGHALALKGEEANRED